MIGDGYSVDRSLCTDCGDWEMMNSRLVGGWQNVMPRGRIQKFISPRRVYHFKTLDLHAYHPTLPRLVDSGLYDDRSNISKRKKSGYMMQIN